jgi:pyruvate formate lyase activating enzyme
MLTPYPSLHWVAPVPALDFNLNDSPLTTSGLVFNIMRFSVHDGPGIRTTVFLKGCPLSCPWCHNPESQSYQPEAMYVSERCISCQACCVACDSGALHWDNGPQRDAVRCTFCGACAEACPAEARKLMGTPICVGNLVEKIRRDVAFFDESGGGVTFSGGEPLAQPRFLEAALAACQSEGIHTVLDTCGYAPSAVLHRVMPFVNHFLYDLKLVDDTRHQNVVGVSNSSILENLAILASEHASLVVRIPVIPGINDDDQNLEQSFQLLGDLGLRKVDLLPFHATGIEKYHRLSLACRMGDLKPPAPEKMQEIAARFSCQGFEIRVGG